MGWDEVKYSLNSTLGTAQHRPLNTQIDELKTTVGNTNDAAGSATSGTLMGKLRNIIERLETIRTYTVTNNTASETGVLSQKLSSIINYTKGNNSASATGTLSQKLSWIGNSLIGAANNTGGTASAGTVMAKLNALITPVKYGTLKTATFNGTASPSAAGNVINLNKVIIYTFHATPRSRYSESYMSYFYQGTVSVTVNGTKITTINVVDSNYKNGIGLVLADDLIFKAYAADNKQSDIIYSVSKWNSAIFGGVYCDTFVASYTNSTNASSSSTAPSFSIVYRQL